MPPLRNNVQVSSPAFRDEERGASGFKVIFDPSPPPAATLRPRVSNRANALRARPPPSTSSTFLSCDILKRLPALKIHERDQLSVNGERRRRVGCVCGGGQGCTLALKSHYTLRGLWSGEALQQSSLQETEQQRSKDRRRGEVAI